MDESKPALVSLCGCNGNPACPTAEFALDGSVVLADVDQPNAALRLTEAQARQLSLELRNRGY